MTYTQSDGFTTILDKNGNLSAGYQSALAGANMYFTNTPTNPSTLFGAFNASTHLATANPITTYGLSNELTMDTGTQRQKGAVEGDYRIGSWLLSSSVSHEHKEGTIENTMTTGGNNAGMVSFPMPVDYNTDVFTAAAAYESDNMQAKLSYRVSSFSEGDPGGYQFEGWNFAAYNNTTAKTYTSYPKSGDYATPPSNIAQDFRGEIGYNFDTTTRVMATAAYGLQIQNAPFVPATELGYITTNPAGASLAAQLATNPGSLNGSVQTFFGNVVFTSAPLPKLNIKATYSVDARTPDTKSMAIYGDPTDTTALKFRQAVPESWVKQKLSLEVGYHILPETKVTASYQFQNDQRTNTITRLAQDSQASLGVHSMLTDTITGSIDYLHAVRSASAPNFNFWLTEIQADCGSTITALGCQQVPFYEAARVENTVNGRASATLSEAASLSVFGKYDTNNYHVPAESYSGILNPSTGLQHMSNIQAGPDLNYQISPIADVHFYYTFLRYTRDQRNLNGNNLPGGNNYYSVDSRYDIHSTGIGGTWHVRDNLKLVGDYLLSYGGETFVQTGSWDTGFPGDPLLNTRSVNNQVKLHLDYAYSATSEYYLGYEFELSGYSRLGAYRRGAGTGVDRRSSAQIQREQVYRRTEDQALKCSLSCSLSPG